MDDVAHYISQCDMDYRKGKDDIVALPAFVGHGRAVALVQAQVHWERVLSDVAEIVAWVKDQQKVRGSW